MPLNFNWLSNGFYQSAREDGVGEKGKNKMRSLHGRDARHKNDRNVRGRPCASREEEEGEENTHIQSVKSEKREGNARIAQCGFWCSSCSPIYLLTFKLLTPATCLVSSFSYFWCALGREWHLSNHRRSSGRHIWYFLDWPGLFLLLPQEEKRQ